MKSFNTHFYSYKKLEKFISKNSELAQSQTTLVQIFSGVIKKKRLKKITQTIQKLLPTAYIIGSTTDGEILDDEVTTNNIVLSFTTFEKSTLSLSYIEESNSYKCGKNLAQQLYNKESKLFILFATGLDINGEEFLKGVNSEASDIIVAGGLSGDNAQFKKNYLICNDKILNSGAVGVSINSKSLYVHNDQCFAWKTIGRKFKVNHAIENCVYEIDGLTPYKLYEQYLGQEIASKLPEIGIEFPLIIEYNNKKIARAPIQLNADGSMVFAGNINTGCEVKFSIGNVEELLQGSKKLVKKTAKKPCESIFIYSCMARRRFFNKKASLDIFGFNQIAPVSGFFTYGEFFKSKKNSYLLNESLTMIALSENDTPKKSVNFSKQLAHDELLNQKALSHIVNTTSFELDQLNKELEKKVLEKTKENLEQEQYIQEQAKLIAMGEMMENIAHQWRQPLSAITSIASSIQVQNQLKLLSDEELHQYLSNIMKNSQFLSETIDIFRNFIKEEKIMEDHILQDRIKLSLQIIQNVLNDHKIELINLIDEKEPIHIRMITGEFSQVLINILNNAKDALLEKKIKNPWIKVRTQKESGHIIIQIEDNAGGIAQNSLNKVFDPYFTTKHQSQGTGIGLYMSHKIITMHLKGRLYVTNTVNGAQFTIELPLEQEES